MEEIRDLDGAGRQQLAADIWQAWHEHQRGAVVLSGFSGVGKTDKVVRPLLTRARREQKITAYVEIPANPTNLDEELKALLIEDLRLGGASGIADACNDDATFGLALSRLLRAGAIVVLDEFQHVIDLATSKPREPIGMTLRRMAQRPADGGCLWLVLNRSIEPAWTEPFYARELPPPEKLEDIERIVLQSIDKNDADQRFPRERRLEVARRLGGNPRALRFLGNLLRRYELEELLGPPTGVPETPADGSLIDALERNLLAKATDGLSPNAHDLLKDLSVLRGSFRKDLLNAIGSDQSDVQELSEQLRDRYLLSTQSNRLELHPIAREVNALRLQADVAAWRSAHRRAGDWYARPLLAKAGNPPDDLTMALHLAGARYHLLEASAADEMRTVTQSLGAYVERQYGWTTRRAIDAAERDARIGLLDMYLEEPGPPGVEYQLALLLKERGEPADIPKALRHARLAAIDQDFHHPWSLWLKLVYSAHGPAAATKAAREAIGRVAPAKSLYSIYQLLGQFLALQGLAEEAVAALLDGAERCEGNSYRLVEEASLVAAAESSDALLLRIRDWLSTKTTLDQQVALCNVLLLESRHAWADAARAAAIARKRFGSYLTLALHEAWSWLGAGKPAQAQEALDQFPRTRPLESRAASAWVGALISLRNGEKAEATRFLSIYLGSPAPETEAGILSTLLREWDHRIATLSELNPSAGFPIMPAIVAGLAVDYRRSQYGPPVLPQHKAAFLVTTAPADGLRVLSICTEWSSGHGGLSTFNRLLCSALSVSGIRTVCLVPRMTPAERNHAAADGVELVGAAPVAGSTDEQLLARKPRLPDGFVPDIIIGHGRITGPAAMILMDNFPDAKRLHFIHTAPDELEWLKPGRDDDPGQRAEDRTQIEYELARTAYTAVAVGPHLYGQFQTELHPDREARVIRFDPGFDLGQSTLATVPPGDPWRVLVTGRLEDHLVKGLDIAARALGLASSRRAAGLASVRLVARGAPPIASAELRDMLRSWSNNPSLDVVVRPFTANSNQIDDDIRRASLFLMPSRAEGFGLAGLEAITAGIPTLVSGNSGLGRLLREVLEPDQADRIIIPMSGDDAHDSETWARAIEGALRDRQAAFLRAAEMRSLLAQQKTWRAAIVQMTAELKTA